MFGGNAAHFSASLDEFALSDEPLEKDSVAAMLLLGDRTSQKVGEIFVCNLFKELE